jgi:hypothetical protein
VGFDPDGVKENFAKQYRKVTKMLEMINIPQLLRIETLIALRDGAFYGVLLSDNNSAFVQAIDPDYCRITSICDGCFLYKVDMSKIGDKLEFYPTEFTEMYSRYLSTGDQWQEVPPDISVCIKADDTLTDYSVPLFSAVMPSLYTVANAEELQETKKELDNYKMLVGKVPTTDKGAPAMAPDTVNLYKNEVINSLDDRIGLAITPFDFEEINFSGKNNVSDVDNFSRAVANFWATAGTSSLLHGGENPTAGVTKLALKTDEAYIYGTIQQIERTINRYLKLNFSGSTRFKISILPITTFNREEYIKYYKEAASFGLGKSHYAAALGIPQYDIAGFDYIEQNLAGLNKLTPMKNSYTSGDEEERGRPKEREEDLSEEGEKTRGSGANENR